MSGAAFQLKGSIGPAPITAFMPPMPSKFTLAISLGLGGSPDPVQYDNQTAANKVSLWHIYNPSVDSGGTGGPNAASCILGSAVTAPDGTNTATHLIEASMSATSAVHRMQAGEYIGTSISLTLYKNMRNAVIAKAAERTRIKLTTMGYDSSLSSDGMAGASSMGVSVVFDLAGGQIGVPAYIFNGTGAPFGDTRNPSIGAVSITPVGGGWYLCFMDSSFPINFPLNYLVTQLTIDAGSGTGAENITYVGDGASGVDVWTSSFLPKPCWDQFSGAVTLFDDFTSTSTIDFADTRAAGFNWYVHGIFPWAGFRATDNNALGHPFRTGLPTDFNQSGSVLEQKAASQHYFCSAASTVDLPGGGSGTWIGRNGPQTGSWQVPALFEFNWALGIPPGSPQNYLISDTACWTFGNRMLMSTYPADVPSINALNTIEIDFSEAAELPQGITSLHSWQHGGIDMGGGGFASWAGYPLWQPGWLYEENPPLPTLQSNVGFGGLHYIDLTTNNIGNNPAGTVGVNWATVADQVTTRSTPDTTQFHTYSCLCTQPTHDDPGWCITFFDGNPCWVNRKMESGNDRNITTIDPTIPNYPNTYAQENFSILWGSPSSASTFMDWIRVTQ